MAPFSTSAPLLVLQPKKKAGVVTAVKNERGVKRTFTRKKDKVQKLDRSRRPAIGERKALRKRIVLSNTNALEVQGLRDFGAESIIDERVRGQVLGIPDQVVVQLRTVEAFKVTQGWPLFRRPAMLVRRETLDLGREMEQIGSDGSKRTIRRVLVGEKGSGKTVMLLQAMSMAFLKGWVVLNIPEAQDLILARTEYGPLPGTSPTQYHQKTYIASLLSALSRANPILAEINLSQHQSTPELPIPIPPNISLSQLALLGASDPEAAWPIFQLLMRDLKLPGRPPLMMCIDGLAHTMQDSHYISAQYKPIHAHDLAIIRFFLDHLSSTSPLPNGGVVMAATSASNNPVIPSLNLALSQLEGKEPVQRDPFAKYDERVLDVFNKGGVEVQRIEGVTKEDARGLMEYWARSGMCRQKVDEGFVGEKWSLSGGGCVGELERAVVRMRV